jgi:hypothetical protein
MAGVTKNLSNFTEGISGSQNFVVNSSLSNIIISNSSSTLDIYVTVVVSLPISAAVSNLVKEIKVPPTVSLNLLDNNILKVQTAKAAIYYDEPTANTDNLMTVTYTSS